MTNKRDAWDRKSKGEQYAAILYSQQTDKPTQDAMLTRQGGAKALEGSKLLSDHERGCVSKLGGTAKK
jgi:hypothetical protein